MGRHRGGGTGAAAGTRDPHAREAVVAVTEEVGPEGFAWRSHYCWDGLVKRLRNMNSAIWVIGVFVQSKRSHTVLAMCYTFFGLLWCPLCAGKVRVPVCLVSRTIAESKKKHEEKQLKAQQLREKLREEKNHKLQKLLERVSREPLVRPGPIGSRERSAARPPSSPRPASQTWGDQHVGSRGECLSARLPDSTR